MDPSLVVAERETFFFEQEATRRRTKRYRKQPDDLPHDLRFAHLNPRVAAYLASKEKDQKLPGEFDDGLGNKSLLPQINQTVSLIRHRLDSILSSESDAQRCQYQESRGKSGGVLEHLTRVLDLYRGLHVHIPMSLEHQLLYGWRELTLDAKYATRDWQIPANKEAHEKSLKIEVSSKDSEFEEESVRDTGRRTRSKMTRSTPGHQRDGSVEGRGDPMVRLIEPSSGIPNIMASKDRQNRKMSATPKYRSSQKGRMSLPDSGKDLRPASAAGSRSSMMKSRRSSVRHDDGMSVLAESMSDGTRSVAQPSFTQTIQFQLSSKLCDDRGWIVHPGSNDEKELKNALEWCTQRLQLVLKHKGEEKLLEDELHLDQTPTIKYYGDGQKDQVQKYKGRSSMRLNTALVRGEKPKIPTIPDGEGRPLYMTSMADGSVTVFYPSGQPAVVTSRSTPGSAGYYSFVYDDLPDPRLLAVFTPAGRGCSYHDNGTVNFLCSADGGTVSESCGAIKQRWTWPPGAAKLPVPVIVQLNSSITLRCHNSSQIHLHYNCQKEQTKLTVGITPGAETPTREELGHLQTHNVFSSHTSREFARPYKPKPSPSKTKIKGRGKSRSPVPPSEIQKLLADLPMEKTENDVNADKELIKLQRKVRLVTEDWLEHYRMAVGLMSPQLKTMREFPSRKATRNVNSAKPLVGGGIALLELAATQIARPSLSYRAPSAPVSRTARPQSAASDQPSDHPSDPGQQVKFVDYNEDVAELPDHLSLERISTFPSSSSHTGSVISSKLRTKSAPLRLSTADNISANIGLCPVALRMSLLGEEGALCRCSRHHIPYMCDIEFDSFLERNSPPGQLLIISVVSSIYPESNHGQSMLKQLFEECNRNRTRPCTQSRADSYRIMLYDIATAAHLSHHKEPLLLRRHNVIPGMFLIYEGGKLYFCDHIFNGYGNERKNLEKQMLSTKRSISLGHSLPSDFRFSPQQGRHGLRAAWGGQIGGAGVDHHGGSGVTLLSKKWSSSSTSSSDSDLPYAFHVSGIDTSLKVVRKSLNASAYNQLPATPRAQIRPVQSVSQSLPSVQVTRAHRKHVMIKVT